MGLVVSQSLLSTDELCLCRLEEDGDEPDLNERSLLLEEAEGLKTALERAKELYPDADIRVWPFYTTWRAAR